MEVMVVLMGKTERAQGLVEYAMILLLVAVVVILVITLFGSAVGDLFSKMINSFPK
jgi:pilus assembly protein Flp/PilA